MTTWAIVPVKSFGRAKSRLDTLSPDARGDLAQTLLARTLDAVASSTLVTACLVATDCPVIAASMTARGHVVQRDLESEPLGAVIDRALTHATVAGASRAVVIMSDLPLVTGPDIDSLVRSLGTADAAIAPDRQDAGTNALALQLPAAAATCFGHADSFDRHVRAMGHRHQRVFVARNPRLAFDVDVPSDLEAVAPELLARCSA